MVLLRLLLSVSGLGFTQESVEASLTLIHAGTPLVEPGEDPLEKQTVIIKNGRILIIRNGFLSESDIADKNAQVEVIDLKDAFVLPGMMDMHTHFTLQLGDPRFRNPIQGPALLSEVEMGMDAVAFVGVTLDAGFTTVRNMGSWGGEIFAL